MISIINEFIKIDTPNTTLLLRTINGQVEKLYYGRKLKNDSQYHSFCYNEIEDPHASIDDTTTTKTIFSCTGDGNNKESLVLLQDEMNRFINRFILSDVTLQDDDQLEDLPHAYNKKKVLKITYIDQVMDIELNQYIGVFDENDAITFRSEVINKSSKVIKVKRLMSLQLDFYDTKTTIYTFDGAWARERNMNKTTLTTGVFMMDSKSGFSSNGHNPFMMVENKHQGIIGLNLIYSGNHKEIVERSPLGGIRVLTGMNDYMFSWDLEPNTAFQSPEAVVVYGECHEDITTQMHKFIRNHLVRKDFSHQSRPILINNWEATYFDFDKDKLIHLANQAKDLGIELFVLDDGWFGKRDSDNSSLGDWFDYKEKTGGLANLANQIKSKGLKFGLWVEPEMISFNSELYRNHPDYMMKMPEVNPIEKREQQMLDLVNEDVQAYITTVLGDLFLEVSPDYVKWDCNRTMTDVFNKDLSNHGEYYHRYMLSLYKTVKQITERFPNILFESCSAGGNRFDLGMLYYMPQTWASDNSDARDRVTIQEGTLYGYPQNTMGSHVSICPNHQTGASTSLESRFNIAAVGAFGYEMDITKCTHEELETIKEQICFYKKHRELLQFGNYYRINSAFDDISSGWIIVSEDKSEAIATLVITSKQTNWVRPMFQLLGLNEDYKYKVTMRKQSNVNQCHEVSAYGDVLNAYGLDFGNFFDETDREENSHSIASRMIILKRILE